VHAERIGDLRDSAVPLAADLMRSWDGHEAYPAYEYRFVGLTQYLAA
jgi:hypothetical protein